jgi:hypothetical protein
VGPKAGLDGCGKSRPLPFNGIRSPGRPARSESLLSVSKIIDELGSSVMLCIIRYKYTIYDA